jgi:hypothetical protein
MERLPIEQWKIQFTDTGVLVGAYCNGPDGANLWWIKLKLSDFPKDIFRIDDLKRAVVVTVDASPVPESPSLRALRGA